MAELLPFINYELLYPYEYFRNIAEDRHFTGPQTRQEEHRILQDAAEQLQEQHIDERRGLWDVEYLLRLGRFYRHNNNINNAVLIYTNVNHLATHPPDGEQPSPRAAEEAQDYLDMLQPPADDAVNPGTVYGFNDFVNYLQGVPQRVSTAAHTAGNHFMSRLRPYLPIPDDDEAPGGGGLTPLIKSKKRTQKRVRKRTQKRVRKRTQKHVRKRTQKRVRKRTQKRNKN